MCGHSAQNLLVLRSPQLPFTSGPAPVSADMDLYRRYMGFSPASKGLAMLSQSKIGPAVAGSAGPAPPPLRSRKDATTENGNGIESRNTKKLTKISSIVVYFLQT